MRILRLNKAGDPLAWITKEEAAVLYCKDLVLWELGDRSIHLHGGQNNAGNQSILSLASIVASDGSVKKHRLSIGLTNRTLFRRDENRCLYCGDVFPEILLTRDHIFPKARGGPDSWTNIVCACGPCNRRKDCRTPEEAGMQLLALPFEPNPFEYMYLANRKILGDQMDYLRNRFSRNRQWAA